jgi:hypothetical protein
MAQVISASRRTDIPGFYAEWLVRRLKEGHVYVRQPYNGRMSRVSLIPAEVSALVFWSKNYGPLLPRLEQVEKTTKNLFFHFTITANRELEFHAPDPADAIADYLFIARRYSPDHIVWRYDPVCVTDKLSFEEHEERFVRCVERFQGQVRRCIISFAHPYKKTLVNLRKYTDHSLQVLSPERQRTYASRLADLAGRFGIRLFACCNDHLVFDRIGKANCIDGNYLSALFGSAIDTRRAATRGECNCTRSVDIGDYDTCAHGCVYCYANADKDRACTAQLRHDPEWNSLRMNVRENDLEDGEYHSAQPSLLGESQSRL